MTVASVAIAAGLALSACSGGGSGSGGGGGGTAPEDLEVGGEIQFAWWGGPARNDRTQAVIDLYEENNPEVTIAGTTSEFNAYWENATVQASGGNLPCVPQMQNRTLADYADRGALRPLDDLVESGAIDVSDIPEGVLDSGRGSDGNLYMIPYGAAFSALHINATMLEELGGELPPEGYDWAFLADWLTEMAEADGQPVIDMIGSEDDLFESWTRANGEPFYDQDGTLGITEQTLIDFWEYSEELREADVSISMERASELTGQAIEQSPIAQGEQLADFSPANQGGGLQAALEVNVPGAEVATIVSPGAGEGLGAALWVSGLSIAENCDNVGTAASFIDYFVNDQEAALAFGADNGANVNMENLQALLDSADVPDTKKDELNLFAQLVETGIEPTTYGKAYNSIFIESLTRYYQQIAFGELSVEEAAAQFMQEAEGALGG